MPIRTRQRRCYKDRALRARVPDADEPDPLAHFRERCRRLPCRHPPGAQLLRHCGFIVALRVPPAPSIVVRPCRPVGNVAAIQR